MKFDRMDNDTWFVVEDERVIGQIDHADYGYVLTLDYPDGESDTWDFEEGETLDYVKSAAKELWNMYLHDED
jgi:hypothetical protein